jgi:hypothetical protein
VKEYIIGLQNTRDEVRDGNASVIYLALIASLKQNIFQNVFPQQLLR